jgi:hypothetical protein
MRHVFFALLVGVLTACAVTAGTNPTAMVDPTDAASADPAYCAQFCLAAENAGTLMGTTEDCMHSCCMMVPGGCEAAADGAVNAPDGAADGAGDAQTGDDGGAESGCAVPCGTACCTGNEACVKDSAGKPSCQSGGCTTNADCPPTTPCCEVQSNGQSMCAGKASGQQCRCTTSADCKDTGCCAPMTDSKGDPTGPYVCKADDANPYDCCTGVLNFCGSGFCCVADTKGNEFCATECQGDSTCGGGHCKPYDFSHTSCGGPTACGP